MNTVHTPNLVSVTGSPFAVPCRHCGEMLSAGDQGNALADLKGEPFRAYFHKSPRVCGSHAGEYPAGLG